MDKTINNNKVCILCGKPLSLNSIINDAGNRVFTWTRKDDD
jgi:hypothetical protein